MSGPVMRLQNLSQEDLFILLRNLRNVFAGGDPSKNLVPDDALTAFMGHSSQKVGDAYFRTPRNTVTAFVNLLSVLEQNPGVRWQQLVDQAEVASASDEAQLSERGPTSSSTGGTDDGGQLAAFKL
jgi:hypothetical protein